MRLWRFIALPGLLFAGTVFAQTYPVRPIALIVSFPPGAATDFSARVAANRMTEILGQRVVVQNRDGASGVIGTDYVAKSTPDGYTMLWASSSLTISASTGDKLPYDPVRDFAPVGLIARIPLVLVVHKDVAARSVADVIALAKAAPGKLSYASPGNGGAPHLTAELFSLLTESKLLHVPYKGSGPAVADLAEGRVQMMFDGIPAFLPFLEAGKLRPLAAASLERNKLLPDLPTFAELGYKGMDVALWYGLIAPVGTPEPIVQRLNAELNKVLALPAVRGAFAKQSVDAAPGSPADFTAFMQNELDRWGKVVKSAGIQPE